MIKEFHISQFKSIKDLEMQLHKFTCLVGTNGAGKTTILQALDFVSHIIQGKVTDWLALRNWDKRDLANKNYKNTRIIEIKIKLSTPVYSEIIWEGKFNITSLKCSWEQLTVTNHEGYQDKLHVNQRILNIENNINEIIWDYEGSILSSLQALPEYASHFVAFMSDITSLELLSPMMMRKSSRANVKRLGSGGEKLSGYLFDRTPDEKRYIIEKLKYFYPSLHKFDIDSYQGGWKYLYFTENYNDHDLITGAMHTNDGMLRIIAIVTQLLTDNASVVLLDEIENGINQEIMEKLADFLIKSETQVITTTHSPLFLNYIEDDIARKGVYFVYRKNNGDLGISSFFDSFDDPNILDFAGPGDVFVNTDLSELAYKINQKESQSNGK